RSISAELPTELLGRPGVRLQLLPKCLRRGRLIGRDGGRGHQQESCQQETASKPLATLRMMAKHRNPRFLLSAMRKDESPNRQRGETRTTASGRELGRRG